jgi:hypothetical protein
VKTLPSLLLWAGWFLEEDGQVGFGYGAEEDGMRYARFDRIGDLAVCCLNLATDQFRYSGAFFFVQTNGYFPVQNCPADKNADGIIKV